MTVSEPLPVTKSSPRPCVPSPAARSPRLSDPTMRMLRASRGVSAGRSCRRREDAVDAVDLVVVLVHEHVAADGDRQDRERREHRRGTT
jgi:hypothetical protein